MLNCEICGSPLKQPKKTIFSRIPKYCFSKCRFIGAKSTFEIARNPNGPFSKSDMNRKLK